MTRDIDQLEAQLAKSPEDWSVRLTLIEERIRADDQNGARDLVRSSPDHSPLPVELQFRLHTLMTLGKDSLDPLPPPESQAPTEPLIEEHKADPQPQAEEKKSEGSKPEPKPEAAPKPPIEPVPPAKSAIAEELEKKKPATERKIEPVPPAGFRQKKHPEPVPPAGSKEKKHPEPVPPAKSGSSPAKPAESQPTSKKPNLDEVAPLKDGAKKAGLNKDFSLTKPESQKEIELKPNENASKKWDNYRGNLLLTEADDMDVPERPRSRVTGTEKLSAFTFALIVHLIVLLPLAFVVISAARPNPPQLIVTVKHDKVAELQTTRLTKTKEKKYSAAAAQTVNLISTTGPSTMKIPEMEDSINTEFTSFIPGIEPTGMGMSFAGLRDEVSDVNFFGISGGGDRVVFVVDATRPMLVDEKGGMFAYDKVKNEIAAMLNELRRGTHFNLLLYDGKRLVAFREEMVPGLPSNRRKAVEWMDPLNREYENLGLRNGYLANQIEVEDNTIEPIQARDIAHYAKAIQKALEWKASAVFCISAGFLQINRSPSPEMIAEYKDKPVTPGTPGKVDPAARKAWQEAQKKTREWLEKENNARKEKGLPPKVVINFNALVRQITGATPPRAEGGTPPSGGIPRQPPHTTEDIEKQVKALVKKYFDDEGRDKPSVHMVLFLGDDEEIGQYEDHFKTLTRKNRGKLKILRGLAALENVTE